MSSSRPILVTGGAGFIGGNFIRDWLSDGQRCPVVNLDALTYAGNLATLADTGHDRRYQFVHGDITDAALLEGVLANHRPHAILHFAAETHVDRSIASPQAFIRSNIEGSFVLLEAARNYWHRLPAQEKEDFRFLHISTDEVYGALSADDAPVTETSPYRPNSPYAASKAASDHLVRAWHMTYGLPTIITHCTNNYGAYQHPEKLIPRMILRALRGQTLPLYGSGQQVRDWLHVTDHCAALRLILAQGGVGETYGIGGGNEQTNQQVVERLCDILARLAPPVSCGLAIASYRSLIAPVADRPGHDWRYALDASKLRHRVGWRPATTWEEGLEATVSWYLTHSHWLATMHHTATHGSDA